MIDLPPVPAASGLLEAIARAWGTSPDALSRVEEIPLKPRVLRVRCELAGVQRSVVVKRLEAAEALRSERIARRWLPMAQLSSIAAGLLASTTQGSSIWHVYEDLGYASLDQDPSDERVAAAVDAIATLHARFTSHPTLAECRIIASPYGIDAFTANVGDAIAALDSLAGAAAARELSALRDRLLARLAALLAEAPRRGEILKEWGGADTLLHGDLWSTNVFVANREEDRLEAKLIDWDRAGVGPVSYDVSTFLLRFPAERRGGILDLYRHRLEREGQPRAASRAMLNQLYETAELSRYANRVIWPARAIARENAAWAPAELAAVEGWFEALRPVLPEPGERVSTAPRPYRATVERVATRFLIVNADDFGAGSGVNRGILEAHRRGIVTSASLMVEAPGALEAARASRDAPRLSVGLHLDLPCDRDEGSAAELRKSIDRQAERFLELMGRRPTHIDSHHDVHHDARVLPALLELASGWGIPLRGHSRIAKLPSFYGRWNGESHPEQIGVGSLLDLLASRVGEGTTELICHPGYLDGPLESSYASEREIEVATLCDPRIRQGLEVQGIELIGFHQLDSRVRGEA